MSKDLEEFNKIAGEYDKGRSAENVKLWIEETTRLGSADEESLILDLGCGTGIYTIALSLFTGGLVCGLDPALGMLKQASGKSKNVLWVCSVAESMPIRSNVFHCIFASQVWHHIVDKRKAADECFRVLKKSSSLIVRTISHEQLKAKTVFKYFPEILENQLRVYPSKEDFQKYFAWAGFISIEEYEYNLERYQDPIELIEAAEGKLWSMFRPISKEGLERGVAALRRYKMEHPAQPLRNDETITLIVARK